MDDMHTVAAPPVEEAPALLRLSLLGGFGAQRGGQSVPPEAWKRQSGRTLLKLLALTPEHRLHREQIQDTLWPEFDSDGARDNLRKALHAARHALEPDLPPKAQSSYLRVDHEMIALMADRVWIDVDHFGQLAREALNGGDLRACGVALTAYPSDLLPEDRFAAWAVSRREALLALALRLRERLATLLEQRGDTSGAIARLREVLERDPTREAVNRSLMRLYAQTGSRHQALRQYQAYRHALQTELGVDPDPETEALYHDLLSGASAVHGHESLTVSPLPDPVRNLPSTAFVGRESACDLLAQAYTEATGGFGQMALVSGEAGIGKSRMAAQFARQAAERGAIVLWGTSYDQEGVLPYGPIVEALEGYLREQPLEQRQSLSGRYPELASLVPALPRVTLTPRLPLESERSRLFAALISLFDELSHSSPGAHPLLLVLDDLHVADPDTIQWLHHLMRFIAGRPWLVIGMYQEEGVVEVGALQRFLATTARYESAHRIQLLRLARPDCDRLAAITLGGVVDDAVLEQIAVLTLGNPLFILQVVRSMQEDGQLVLLDDQWHATGSGEVTVPRQVRELMTARVDHLGEDVRRTLGLAAVAGMTFSFALLSAAGERAYQPPLRDGPLLDALDRALAVRILDERGDGYAFRHPLLRATLYAGHSTRRRTRLHAAIAQALEELEPHEVEALSFHCRRGELPEKAARYMERAGDRARARYANEVAATYYLDLLELVGGLDQARAYGKLGTVLTAMACYDEALTILEKAAAIYHSAERQDELASVTAQIGRAHFKRGTPSLGISRIRPLLQTIENDDASPALADLYISLATLFWAAGRFGEQLAAAERAAAAARAADRDDALIQAELWRGYAYLAMDRVQEGVPVLERMMPLAERTGDISSLWRALNAVASVYEEFGEFERERCYLERAIELCRQSGDQAEVAFLLHRQADRAVYTGEWDQARSFLQEALTLDAEIGPSRASPYVLHGLGYLSLVQGQWDSSAKYLDEARSTAERNSDSRALRQVDTALAELDLLCGRPQAAQARLARRPVRGEPTGDEVAQLFIMARIHLALGNVALGRATAWQSMERARALNDRTLMADGLWVQTLTAIQAEDWQAAETAIEEALSLTRSIGYRYNEGRALHCAGTMHARRGEAEAAQRAWTQAVEIFRALGAQADVSSTEEALTTATQTA